ncbi:MAG: EAL domain-containing protein, partial [Gammaproteobacteria bacterium]|nr:EAL domain-containing protein [Gammaproteobacteria bacterium]
LERKLTDAIERQGEEQAEVHAQTILGSLKTLMINGSGTLAREWLDRLHGVAGIKEVEVLRRDGNIAFTDLETVDTVNQYLGKPRFKRELVAPRELKTPLSSGVIDRVLNGEVVRDTSSPGLLTVTMPIDAGVECLTCHGYDQMQMRGILTLSLSTETNQARIQSMRSYLWGGAVVLVTMLGLALWLSIRFNVLKPLAVIRDGIMQVSEGNRSARVNATHNDELGELATVFNRMQDALNASEIRIRAVMDNVVDGVMTLTNDGLIETVNPAVERIFGFHAEELIGEPVAKLAPSNINKSEDFILGPLNSNFESNVLGAVREVNARRSNGTVFPIDVAVSEMYQGGRRYFIAVVRDITSRKARTAALRYQALHDALTDLPNRTLLLDRLQQALRSSQRSKNPVCLILMDLDRFKEVNDTLGHHVGDKLLQQIAKRLRMLLRQSDTVARLGGDEFSVLLPDTTVEQAMVTAGKIVRVIEEPIIVEGQRLNVGTSLGISFSPLHGDSAGLLMQKADVAMYMAKRNNESIAVYDPQRDPHSLRQLAISGELRTAIETSQLVIHYQPKIDLKTNRLSGVEALLRWQHPKHGLLFPDEFIPLSETTGLIRPLTSWLVRNAIINCLSCENRPKGIKLSLNLSMRNLQDSTFPDQITSIFQEYDFNPENIVFEITETALMEEPEQALRAMDRLSELGIGFSIDDFGTGYSSLSYLEKLPVTELKIDKSFGLSLGHDNNSALIVRSTIDLAHKLGLKVAAEGVETKEALNLLISLGCDAVQGFYLAKPMAKDELLLWFDEHADERTPIEA